MINSKYQVFLTVAELGNMTHAAEKLGYTQSGVSQLIGALEKELGVELLTRSKTGTMLTAEGYTILPYIRKAVEAEQNLMNVSMELKGLQTGILRIGTFSSAAIHWLPELLAIFKERYPGVEVQINNGDYAMVEKWLMENVIDCGFVTLPSRKEFRIQSLRHDRMMAIVSEEWAEHREKEEFVELLPQELKAETFIMPAEGRNYDIGKILADLEEGPLNTIEINDDYAAVEMVRRNLGFTILPELMAQNMPEAGIRAIPIKGYDRTIGIAVHRSRYLSPAVNAFLACVKTTLGTIN